MCAVFWLLRVDSRCMSYVLSSAFLAFAKFSPSVKPFAASSDAIPTRRLVVPRVPTPPEYVHKALQGQNFTGRETEHSADRFSLELFVFGEHVAIPRRSNSSEKSHPYPSFFELIQYLLACTLRWLLQLLLFLNSSSPLSLLISLDMLSPRANDTDQAFFKQRKYSNTIDITVVSRTLSESNQANQEDHGRVSRDQSNSSTS